MRNEGIGRQAYQMLQDRPSDEKNTSSQQTANVLPSFKKRKLKMSPVCVHFKTSKRWSSSSLTFSTLRNEKLSPTSIIQTFGVLVKAKCFKKMPHKMWTHSQRIISITRGQESEDSTSVWASVSSMRNLFASLDQFGQTNFNHSHSNEPIRKYTVWPLNPKYLHLLRSSPVQKCAQPLVQPLLPHRRFNVELCHQHKTSLRGSGFGSSLLQVPSTEPSRAAAYTFIGE